jgi:cytochrome c peroxidase
MKKYTGMSRNLLFIVFPLIIACSDKSQDPLDDQSVDILQKTFGNKIDLSQIPDYQGQAVPSYIQKRNTSLTIDNKKSMLGRVLFYDTRLSTTDKVSCASCHQQRFAFSDTSQASRGVNGITGRHSMRLVNVRFAEESKFFWDERASSLGDQVLQPIQDHTEMGFSNSNGNPGLTDLMAKLAAEPYYQKLFQVVDGHANVNDERVRECLVQFVASIQSFDSKYDAGRSQVAREDDNFPNFTDSENRGKRLFLRNSTFARGAVRIGEGLGCGSCHRAPEFDIDPVISNNGFIEKIGGGEDLAVFRAPTLRDIMQADGRLNGKLMHTGTLNTRQVLEHYNTKTVLNDRLDPRLRPEGKAKDLRMTEQEFQDVIAFLRTLSGNQLYTDVKWSDPFVR